MKTKLTIAVGLAAMCGAVVRCSAGGATDDAGQGDTGSDVIQSDSSPSGDGGPSDAASNTLALSCAVTKQAVNPNACPAPSGKANEASFCFRAQWAGVTAVDVFGGFGNASDWTAPFTTLTNDGTGTFTATVPLANGSYPYLFRVHGSADGLVRDNTWLLDQRASEFTAAPAQAPIMRSLPVVTVPQTAPTLHHLRGTVVYEGAPQPCFSVAIDVGELYKDGGGVLSEQSTANYAESNPDGTFDFPIASAQVMAVVRFPFLLAGVDAGYPNPNATPTIGYARTGTSNLGAADVTLDPVEVSYPLADYAAMSPTNGSGTLPQTFTFTVVPASSSASVAVISTNIAGNDPAYWSAFGAATSLVWDGGFGGKAGSVVTGTQYWWGTWQKRGVVDGGTTWNEESLLFPLVY